MCSVVTRLVSDSNIFTFASESFLFTDSRGGILRIKKKKKTLTISRRTVRSNTVFFEFKHFNQLRRFDVITDEFDRIQTRYNSVFENIIPFSSRYLLQLLVQQTQFSDVLSLFTRIVLHASELARDVTLAEKKNVYCFR